MNKTARSKNPLNPRAPFKWVLMDIIPSTTPKRLTSDAKFYKYLLIADSLSEFLKLYGIEKIITEEVMDKLYMFQSISGKIDELGWWDLEIISADADT